MHLALLKQKILDLHAGDSQIPLRFRHMRLVRDVVVAE